MMMSGPASAAASMNAWRSEPGPLSFMLVATKSSGVATVMVKLSSSTEVSVEVLFEIARTAAVAVAVKRAVMVEYGRLKRPRASTLVTVKGTTAPPFN